MAYGSLRVRISSRGTMSTLLPCWLAETSTAEPATPTESTCGAMASFTETAAATGSVSVRKPGAVITRWASAIPPVCNSNVPAAEVTVCASTPTRLMMETCAPATGAPDGSTTVPLTAAADRQAEKIEKEAKRPTYIRIRSSSLESCASIVPSAGLLTCASSDLPAFPFRRRNSGFLERSSALTVAGLCWIFTSFPTPEEFLLPSKCTLIPEQSCASQLTARRGSYYRSPLPV